ncbi:MAG: formylglycine-generating enzyme family protein [Thermoguttaceae bacterium]|jgi:formylglycine-generating enzyme required for sulfatase activity|nr:formylglycine-generating enzyme family protein [Thermoguttaceae bacterium]
MPESFDPYHRWLGIPPKHQPPDYYRLLGIEQFESDREVIRDGADRQMAHVRTYQLGECSALSQKILNELAGARACLLNSERKAAYDERLREQLAGQAVVAPPEPLQPPIPPPVLIAPEAVAPSLEPGAISEIGTGAVVTPTTKRYRPPALALTAGAAAALVLLGALIWSLSGAGDPQTRDSDSPEVAHRRPAERVAPTAAERPEPPDSQPAGTAPPPAVAPFDAKQASRHQQAWAKYLSVPVEKTNSIGMEFVLIPPGEFMMGSPEDEEGRDSGRESPQHRVRITKPFYLGKYPITQQQWQAVMESNPSRFKGPKNPVENVRWGDCQEFLRRLNKRAADPRQGFRLPTEAEWEYACRAGTTTRYSFGDDASQLGEYAWYEDNSDGQTHPVGQKRPNPWGLYDMHGNVYEWCADWFDENYYANSAVNDPAGPSSGWLRVGRGGGWDSLAGSCRSALRSRVRPDALGRLLGFRVVLVPADSREPLDSVASSPPIPEEDELPVPELEARLATSPAAATSEQSLSDLAEDRETSVEPAADSPPDKALAFGERKPVPGSSEQQEVRRAIDDIHETAASQEPAEALKLANKLAELAERAENTTERFVLLRRASELASDGGDARRMLELVGRIGEEYEVDQLLAQAVMLNGFAAKATGEEKILALVDASAGVIEEALAAERVDLANLLSDLVYQACVPPARVDPVVRAAALARRREVQALREQWEKVQEARATLESNPNDEAANTIVGSWYCYVHDNWDQALPHFAKGSDSALQALADREVSSPPESATAQVELADAWWDLAQTAEPDSSRAWLTRAKYWYKQAHPQVTSPLMKAKVAQRLEESASLKLPTPRRPDRMPPLAVAPFDAKQAARHQQAWAKYLSVPVEKTNSIGMEFVLIPPGEFIMGSPESEKDRSSDEGPQHRVRITKPFYLGVYQVTQGEYERVMGTNPSYFSRGGNGRGRVSGLDTRRFPVEQVSWNNAVEFCQHLSALAAERSAGRAYRLPTEAEWEYACRAGTTTRYHLGDHLDTSQARFAQPTGSGRPVPVGSYGPNGFGLYDIHGNVWEWCSDRLDENYYANSPTDDPQGPASGSGRVYRGGSWASPAGSCRSANRSGHAPGIRDAYRGFRLALVPADEAGK